MTNRVAISDADPADEQPFTGFGAWRVLEHYAAAADADVLDSLKNRLGAAMSDFPALAGETVNVGLLHEDADATARAFPHNRLVCFQLATHVSNITLWHELAHVAIRARNEGGDDLPKTSEEFCSIYAVARMPPRVIGGDSIPYLGEPSAPREQWPAICERALTYREDHHDYIKQCRAWLGAER